MNDYAIKYDFGTCDECGYPLEAEWFIEKEYNHKYHQPTGRTRLAVDYLFCPRCFKEYTVDDTFDGNWH